MKVVVIKYNAGNICSVTYALERMGINAVVTNDPSEIHSADKIIFPGVGEASTAMNYLQERKLDKLIVDLKQPVLGICLGMQLMCNYSEEGNTKCLGIFDLNVRKFNFFKEEKLKIPQIGWNNIFNYRSDLFKNINEREYMYFVHSYYAELSDHTIATTNYGIDFSSALQKNNFYGAQFHPEKSGDAGQKVIRNFLALNP